MYQAKSAHNQDRTHVDEAIDEDKKKFSGKDEEFDKKIDR